MRILGFGTYDARAHPRVQVLLDGLREHGHQVEECNVRLDLSTEQRVAVLRQPWRAPALAVRIGLRWVRLVRRARALPPPDVVLVGYLGNFDVLLARRLFRGAPVVLDYLISGVETAVDRRLTGRTVQRLLRRLDRQAVSAADLVVVDTEEHRALVPAGHRHRTVVAAVGAEQAWFDAAATADRNRSAGGDEPLRVVFFGLYTPLQGTPIIGAALALLADDPVEVTMIGHGQEYDAAVAAAGANHRITWRRWVDSAELPLVVAGHDVCLGIFGDGAKARRVVPTKAFQGLAAGCAVITSDTPPQRRALGAAAIFVPPGDPPALAAAVRSLADDRGRLRAARTAVASAAPEVASARAVTAELAAALAAPPRRGSA